MILFIPIWAAFLLGNILAEFVTMMLTPDSTDNVRIPKKQDPPIKPPVNDPPEENPPNKLKLPPTEIFKDPPNKQLPPPPPPTRILPPVLPVSTNTEVDIRSVVKESLLDHKFGCLLARPFYSADETFCEYENTSFQEFFTTLASDIEAQQTELETDIKDGETEIALRVATGYVSTNALSPPALIIGTKNIHKVASYHGKRAHFLSNFEVTGLISTGQLNITDCTIPDEPYEELELSTMVQDECMIPLSAFDELEGYKADQLQVIWRNHDYKTKKKTRYFTIPQPKPIDTFSIDSLKTILPNSMEFGATVIEIWMKIENIDDSIRPIQKTVVMTNHQTAEEIKDFVYKEFQVWVSSVCEKVTIKEYVAKHLDDSKIYVGGCFPYRAVYMGWDKEKQFWFKKADWYLAK
jgi:hypothetical protein